MNVKEQYEIKAKLLEEMQTLVDLAQSESRDLTNEETKKIDSHLARSQAIDRLIAAEEGPRQAQAAQAIQNAAGEFERRGLSTTVDSVPTIWSDRSGNPVRVFNRGEKWASPKNNNEALCSIGNIIRAAATGDPRFMKHEAKTLQNMSGGVNTGGGFLVPETVAGFVIDRARAISALAQAGTVFVPMDSDQMTLATVTGDPSFVTHLENQTITDSDITFGGIGFTAVTIATVVRISRELAADAPNVGALAGEVLAKALAAEIDRQAISGNAGTEFQGLTLNANISQTGSVGAIEWEDIHGGVVAIKAANHNPNAYIVSPTIGGDLDLIVSGNGTNSAKMWLTAPPSVANLTRYDSTNISNGFGIIGDFTKSAFGLRQGALLEATTTGGDAFTKHSVLVKITWRGCFRVLQAGAFHRLAGITT